MEGIIPNMYLKCEQDLKAETPIKCSLQEEESQTFQGLYSIPQEENLNCLPTGIS